MAPVAHQVNPLQWDTDRLDAFIPSVNASPFGPLGTPLEVLGGCYLYEYLRRDEIALIAVRPVVRQLGTRLDIAGIVSQGAPLSRGALDLALLEIANAHGAQLMAQCTQHPALVKACARKGWGITGAVMLKPVSQQ